MKRCNKMKLSILKYFFLLKGFSGQYPFNFPFDALSAFSSVWRLFFLGFLNFYFLCMFEYFIVEVSIWFLHQAFIKLNIFCLLINKSQKLKRNCAKICICSVPTLLRLATFFLSTLPPSNCIKQSFIGWIVNSLGRKLYF